MLKQGKRLFYQKPEGRNLQAVLQCESVFGAGLGIFSSRFLVLGALEGAFPRHLVPYLLSFS
jgi:hypothetical protein